VPTMTVHPRHITQHTRRIALATLTALTIPTAITLTATPAAADPTTTAWAQLRNCESGDNYTIVSVNGHYGAYQFDLSTWRSVGGTGKPNHASPAEQDYRALYLYRMRGWQPWACARMLRLHPDRDAASKRIPTRAQATYISGPTTTAMPRWPGKVYSYGDCDPALRAWQLRMNHYGMHFQGTGCYYTKTKAAVLAVQRANHIKTSGLLGPKTWRAAWQGKTPH
jgi:resuscitation-promoting factor RpfA